MDMSSESEVDIVSVADTEERIVPVVFDSPHSGTAFPSETPPAASNNALLRASDLFVDALFGSAPLHGAALLCAHFSRVFIDPNRPLTDIDPAVVAGKWPGPVQMSARTAKGIGLVWRVAPDQSEIYAKPLSVAEIQHRIATYWHRYHGDLLKLLELRRRRFGAVWHVNCHSMPGTGTRAMGDEGQRRADIIVGDLDGVSCSADFRACVVEFLRAKGLDVRVNELFKGAEIVKRYGDPASHSHSIQVEINRSLYMDEQTCTKRHDFDGFRKEVTAPLIEAVCAFAADEVRHRGDRGSGGGLARRVG